VSEQAPVSHLWAMRTGNVISVRRGYRTVLSMYGEDEARSVAESILEAIDAKKPGL
jgi:hypothetical protein